MVKFLLYIQFFIGFYSFGNQNEQLNSRYECSRYLVPHSFIAPQFTPSVYIKRILLRKIKEGKATFVETIRIGHVNDQMIYSAEFTVKDHMLLELKKDYIRYNSHTSTNLGKLTLKLYSVDLEDNIEFRLEINHYDSSVDQIFRTNSRDNELNKMMFLLYNFKSQEYIVDVCGFK